MNRKGTSLIEVLIVMAILALMVGLLLSAVQKVRSVASGMKAKNQLRQIILAGHNYASANQGNLPSATSNDSIYYLMAVLPYLEVHGPVSYSYPPYGIGYRFLPIYLSEDDYSVGIVTANGPHAPTFMNTASPVSLGLNAVALTGVTSLAGQFSDGTSNTIGVSERLFGPQSRANYFGYQGIARSTGPFDGGSLARGNFADAKMLDVLPVTTGSPPRTRASTLGVTFQVMPKWLEADGAQLQALQPGGLKVAMLDGSVRTIHPGVSEGTFWGLVTPAAGDIAEID